MIRGWSFAGVAAALVVAGSGCTTYTAKTDAIVQEYRSGMTESAIAKLDQRVARGGKDQVLNLAEAARMKLVDGQVAASRAQFSAAIERMIEVKEGAVFSVKGGTSTLFASTLGNDGAIPYNLAGYELVMALEYAALASLMMGDPEGAAVELRRAVYFQDEIAAEYEREIEKARQDAETKHAKEYGALSGKYQDMAPVLGRVKNSFQNSYVWYTAGVMYEMNRDPGNAYIAYKKAWELVPNNPVLQQDLVRLSASEHEEEHAAFKEKFGLSHTPIPDAAAEIIVFFEENQISRRQSVKIPLPLGPLGFQALLFPVYQDGPYRPATIQVSVDSVPRGNLEPLCYLQSLAYHDLRERMPGIMVRNVTRAISRGALQKGMMDSDNAGVKLIGLASQVALAVAEEADTRAWSTLPMAVQVYRRSLPAGPSTVLIQNVANGASMSVPLDLAPGEKRLIWVADILGRAAMGGVSLNRAGETTTLATSSGILDSVAFGIAGNEPRFAPVVPAPVDPSPSPVVASADAASPPQEAVPPAPQQTNVTPNANRDVGSRPTTPPPATGGMSPTRGFTTPAPVSTGGNGNAGNVTTPRFGIF